MLTPTNIITITTTLGMRNKYDPGITVHYGDCPSRSPLEGIYAYVYIRIGPRPCQMRTEFVCVCSGTRPNVSLRPRTIPEPSAVQKPSSSLCQNSTYFWLHTHAHTIGNFYNIASRCRMTIIGDAETDAEISWSTQNITSLLVSASQSYIVANPHARRENSSLVPSIALTIVTTPRVIFTFTPHVVYRASSLCPSSSHRRQVAYRNKQIIDSINYFITYTNYVKALNLNRLLFSIHFFIFDSGVFKEDGVVNKNVFRLQLT